VSVTQSFNTTTSMGRLTLNILLSFAQFEREVIGERIRDKFAASRKKGMWMGGFVPLGYDLKERKLVINEAEAATVQRIFEKFTKSGSVKRLVVLVGQKKAVAIACAISPAEGVGRSSAVAGVGNRSTPPRAAKS
jgi:DNA invertase Pin-like site-specific DNA recombinase